MSDQVTPGRLSIYIAIAAFLCVAVLLSEAFRGCECWFVRPATIGTWLTRPREASECFNSLRIDNVSWHTWAYIYRVEVL